MKNLKYCILASVFSLFVAIPVFAQPDVKLILENKKVVTVNGKEILKPNEKVKPGDILLYTLKVINKGDSAAYELEPEGEIPKNTVYIPENKVLKDFKMSFSIDNGTTFAENPKIKIKQNGKQVLKDAPIELYNRIRWTFIQKLEPNKPVTLTFKVKVK